MVKNIEFRSVRKLGESFCNTFQRNRDEFPYGGAVYDAVPLGSSRYNVQLPNCPLCQTPQIQATFMFINTRNHAKMAMA